MTKQILTIILILPLIFISSGILFSQTKTDKIENTKSSSYLDDQTGGFKLSGTYKNFFLYNNTDHYIGKDTSTIESKKLFTDLSRLRLTPEYQYGKFFLFHADIDNELISSNYTGTRDFKNLWVSSDYNDLLDMTSEAQRGEKNFYRMNIHRAYMKLTIKDLVFTLGRQQIRFGSGRLWNPLDILNPVSPTFVEGNENQKGRDALKGDYYFNDFTVLTAVYDPGRYENLDGGNPHGNSSCIGRFKTSVASFDAAILAGVISRRDTAGTDMAVNIYNGLLRGSILVSKSEDEKKYFLANAGYEYTFDKGLYFLIEYFYNQNGLNSNRKLKALYEESFLTGINEKNYIGLSNQLFTYNKHYAGIALGYDLHPLFRVEVFMIYDFAGNGLFINPGLKYNLMQNIDITAGAMLGKVIEETGKVSDFKEYEYNRMYMGSIIIYF